MAESPLADRLQALQASGGDEHARDLAAIERMIAKAEAKLDRAKAREPGPAGSAGRPSSL